MKWVSWGLYGYVMNIVVIMKRELGGKFIGEKVENVVKPQEGNLDVLRWKFLNCCEDFWEISPLKCENLIKRDPPLILKIFKI